MNHAKSLCRLWPANYQTAELVEPLLAMYAKTKQKGVTMQATQLRDFRIPARHIAELSWGKGGTHSYRCNRKGAYYYSCSGHGGYVVDGRCLTKAERRKIARYRSPMPLRILVQHRNGRTGNVVIGVGCRDFISCGNAASFRGKSYRYSPSLGKIEWQEIPVYLFEEDCDWAILEKRTDIRAEMKHLSDKKRATSINRTFRQWAKPIAERG